MWLLFPLRKSEMLVVSCLAGLLAKQIRASGHSVPHLGVSVPRNAFLLSRFSTEGCGWGSCWIVQISSHFEFVFRFFGETTKCVRIGLFWSWCWLYYILIVFRSTPQSDLLLGILDIIEPELFLKEAQEPTPAQQLLLVRSASGSLPAPSPGAVGAAPVKLEALNELIQFDHIYTKPVVEEEKEGVYEVNITGGQDTVVFSSSSEDEEVEVEVETMSIKDEPEEVVIPVTDSDSIGDSEFLSEVSSSFRGYDKAAYLMSDTYSDSGYERSPSPFSDMSSPLCSDSSWEDMFANELFPQLISV